MQIEVENRIDIRIRKEQRDFIKYVSKLRGFESISDFIVYCINNETSKINTGSELKTKVEEDKQMLVDKIFNPTIRNPKQKMVQ